VSLAYLHARCQYVKGQMVWNMSVLCNSCR
jgi:hypothetical protein